MISESYASVSLDKVGPLWRLRGPKTGRYLLRSETTSEQGGGCAGRATHDLVVDLEDPQGVWLEPSQLREPAGVRQAQGPCYWSLRPLKEGWVSLRVSYPWKKGTQLRLQKLESSSDLIVDHWVHVPEKREPVRAPAEFAISGLQTPSFEDDLGWKKLLGLTGEATDLSSPELDKFRGFDLETNPGLEREAIERRALTLPVLDIPFMETPLKMDPIPLKHRRVVESGNRDRQAFAEGFNYIVFLFERGEWMKAKRAFEVLSKSSVGKQIDYESPYTWALLGQLDFELFKKQGTKEFLLSALELWRKGLRRTVKEGYEAAEHDVYMIKRFAQELYKAEMHYALASLTTWAEKHSWPAAVVEEIQFWKAESLYQLRLYAEARELFQQYYSSRMELNGRARLSDHLMAAALFRVGDVYSREKKWALAVDAYSEAIKNAPTSGRFAFEGAWYPTVLKDFSEALMNRAEANMRLGQYRAAARDYRSFMYIDGNHRYFGLALYRIADVLRLSGAPREKYLGALNECIFKTASNISDLLCRAQRAAFDMENEPKEQWPRLLGAIEDLHKNYDKVSNAQIFSRDELTGFSNLLASWVFIKRKEAFQALSRVETNFKLQTSPLLAAWSEEFSAVSFAGFLESLLSRGEPHAVIESFEKRRHGWMFKRNRPHIVARVAAAYGRLHLWKQAHEALNVADRLRTLIPQMAERPFDLSSEEWNLLKAEIQLELAESGDLGPEVLWDTLEILESSRPETHRLWLNALTRLKASDEKKLIHFEALAKLDALGWIEVKDYASTLERLKRTEQERAMLEQRIGSWMARGPASIAPEGAPPLALILRLSELRAQSQELDLALSSLEQVLLWPSDALSLEERARVYYEKARVLQKIGGRDSEVAQAFEQARLAAPESVWAKLSLVTKL